MTLLLYDLLLLLPTEIDYVWLPRPVHPLLLLFALNRYLPLIDTSMIIHWLLHESSAAQCRLLAFITAPLAAVCIFASQVILMVRTYAIWDRHRVVLWCFIGIGTFCFIPEVVGLGLHLRTIQFAGPVNHPDCLRPSSNATKLLYIPVIVSETIIALLTLFKGVQHLRRSSHPFIKELYVSGMFFYACILFITLANILVPMWVPGIALFLAIFKISCIPS
ncbi:hypothetical protein IW262DRAFT_1065925 [Armillaria fumosa]|nr:hypothetical protein IW262DRAFT_1065925 [Armillaria fumosa]